MTTNGDASGTPTTHGQAQLTVQPCPAALTKHDARDPTRPPRRYDPAESSARHHEFSQGAGRGVARSRMNDGSLMG